MWCVPWARDHPSARDRDVPVEQFDVGVESSGTFRGGASGRGPGGDRPGWGGQVSQMDGLARVRGQVPWKSEPGPTQDSCIISCHVISAHSTHLPRAPAT